MSNPKTIPKVHYVQLVKSGDEFQPDQWHPWKNCKGHEEAALLATSKYMRESGYACRGAQFEAFELMVYVADSQTPRHGNGRFMSCHGFKLLVSPNQGANHEGG